MSILKEITIYCYRGDLVHPFLDHGQCNGRPFIHALLLLLLPLSLTLHTLTVTVRVDDPLRVCVCMGVCVCVCVWEWVNAGGYCEYTLPVILNNTQTTSKSQHNIKTPLGKSSRVSVVSNVHKHTIG